MENQTDIIERLRSRVKEAEVQVTLFKNKVDEAEKRLVEHLSLRVQLGPIHANYRQGPGYQPEGYETVEVLGQRRNRPFGVIVCRRANGELLDARPDQLTIVWKYTNE